MQSNMHVATIIGCHGLFGKEEEEGKSSFGLRRYQTNEDTADIFKPNLHPSHEYISKLPPGFIIPLGIEMLGIPPLCIQHTRWQHLTMRKYSPC